MQNSVHYMTNISKYMCTYCAMTHFFAKEIFRKLLKMFALGERENFISVPFYGFFFFQTSFMNENYF